MLLEGQQLATVFGRTLNFSGATRLEWQVLTQLERLGPRLADGLARRFERLHSLEGYVIGQSRIRW